MQGAFGYKLDLDFEEVGIQGHSELWVILRFLNSMKRSTPRARKTPKCQVMLSTRDALRRVARCIANNTAPQCCHCMALRFHNNTAQYKADHRVTRRNNTKQRTQTH